MKSDDSLPMNRAGDTSHAPPGPPNRDTSIAPPLTDESHPPRTDGTRFRARQFHARGGLGEVYVAEDLELNRQVALKCLRGIAPGESARARFVREAAITGRLEHPGVVPVYGLLAGADGQPFYAMRFIRGETMEAAIDRYHASAAAAPSDRMLQLRSLLQRFNAVCNTLAYAHSHNIIHRDLKPANVMLGEYGETLVVDWGLARLVDESDIGQAHPHPGPVAATEVVREDLSALGIDPATVQTVIAANERRIAAQSDHTPLTQAGFVIGTPAYMSPEQAGGERLGPASDIFSLGALLYAILTGQPPYRGAAQQKLLEEVRNARFMPPSRVRPEVPRPLEAICLKAMRREPGARYKSASDLAADIDRWLADEPVGAWTEPLAARLSRWMRRHRALVWATGFLLSLSAAFFAALAIQADKARDRSLAEQKRTAEESQRANANLDRAMLAVDKMLVQLGKKRLAGVPQIEPIRRDMLTDALGVYQQMLQDNPTEPKLRLAAGKAAVKVGDIQMLLGNLDAATTAYRRGIASLEKLITDRPDMKEAVEELARAYDQAAIAVMQDDPSRPADDEEIAMRVRSDARRGYANQTGDTGRYTPAVRDEVEKLCQRGLQLWELAGGGPEPTDLKCRSGLAIGYYRLAHLLVHTGRRVAGEAAFQKTRHHQEAIVRAEPNDPEEQALLGSISLSEGAHYLRTGQWDDAEAAYNRGTAAYEKLKPNQLDDIEKHPTELGFGRHAIALMRQLARQWAEADAGYQAALAIREPLARDHRDVADYQFDWARTQLNRGTLFLASGRASEALPIFDDVTDRLTPILAKSPSNSTAKQMLAYAHRGRAETLTKLGQLNEAIASWDRAIELVSARDRDLFTIGRIVAVVRKDGPAAADSLKPLIDKPDAPPGLLFEAACAFAQASPALNDRAAELIKRCAAVGHFRDPAPRRQLLDAPELAEIRKRADVQTIIRESDPIR